MDSERTHLVVVAEDDPLLRLDARLSLEEAGFTVIEAGDAPTALTAIEENAEVEALFTDVQMPGAFGGLDLAHRQTLRDGPGRGGDARRGRLSRRLAPAQAWR